MGTEHGEEKILRLLSRDYASRSKTAAACTKKRWEELYHCSGVEPASQTFSKSFQLARTDLYLASKTHTTNLVIILQCQSHFFLIHTQPYSPRPLTPSALHAYNASLR